MKKKKISEIIIGDAEQSKDYLIVQNNNGLKRIPFTFFQLLVNIFRKDITSWESGNLGVTVGQSKAYVNSEYRVRYKKNIDKPLGTALEFWNYNLSYNLNIYFYDSNFILLEVTGWLANAPHRINIPVGTSFVCLCGKRQDDNPISINEIQNFNMELINVI